MTPFPTFDEFFAEVWGFRPYRWQREAADALTQGRWYEALCRGTGQGKTAFLTIYYYALGRQCLSDKPRTLPIRIVPVVQQRLVVDHWQEHAKRLAERLETGGPAARTVAEAVTRRLGCSKPLELRVLRGGLDWDDRLSWGRMPEPHQPAVLSATPDQFGSRLLGAGYGISNRMRRIHSGLLAVDTTVIADESHTIQPLVQTIKSVQGQLARFAPKAGPLPPPLKLIEMSATLVRQEDAFPLSPPENDPTLARRLAPKRAVLAESTNLPKDLADAAIDMLGKKGMTVVGVVANTVGKARQTYQEVIDRLKKKKGPVAASRVFLFTARCRNHERKGHRRTIQAQFEAATRTADPAIVIGTQTFEVGADLDFDGMVLELSSLDSVLQRVGRLNRRGLNPHSFCRLFFDTKRPESVYGPATKATYDHLKGLRKREDEPFALPTALFDGCDDLLAPRNQHAAFGHEVAKMLATGVVGHEVLVDPYIHGVDPSGRHDEAIHLVWRASITRAMLKAAWVRKGDPTDDQREMQARIAELVRAVPPTTAEKLELPRYALFYNDFGDLERQPAVEKKQPASPVRWSARLCVRLDAKGATVVPLREVGPGQVAIIPAEYGGHDQWGWNPHAIRRKDAVADVSNNKHRYLLLDSDQPGGTKDFHFPDDEAHEELDPDQIEAAVPAEAGLGSPRTVIPLKHSPGYLLRVVNPAKREAAKRLSLAQHTLNVQKRVERYAEGLCLPAPVQKVLTLTARYHDAGKAHPRFQEFLYHPAPPNPNLLLARSRHRRSDTPLRHEMQSLHLCLQGKVWHKMVPGLPQYAELFHHLVSSHHGHGRPHFKPSKKMLEPMKVEPFTFTLNAEGSSVTMTMPGCYLEEPGFHWGVSHRFVHLLDQYGPFWLSYLEALFVMGDHNSDN